MPYAVSAYVLGHVWKQVRTITNINRVRRAWRQWHLQLGCVVLFLTCWCEFWGPKEGKIIENFASGKIYYKHEMKKKKEYPQCGEKQVFFFLRLLTDFA